MFRLIPPGRLSLSLFTILALTGSPSLSSAHSDAPARPKTSETTAKPGKPLLVGTYGDWGAYAAKTRHGKTCYALTQPKDREPSNLKRDPGYIFIADRPAENVHDEISIIMGYDVKSGDEAKKAAGKPAVGEPTATIGNQKFILIAKGGDLWLKNLARQGPMLAAMRRGTKLVVQATSQRGHLTTDDYSLIGLTQALDRVQKECR